MSRPVKLGRKMLFPPAFHWAVQVGDDWYEVTQSAEGNSSSSSSGSGSSSRSSGFDSSSKSGSDSSSKSCSDSSSKSCSDSSSKSCSDSSSRSESDSSSCSKASSSCSGSSRTIVNRSYGDAAVSGAGSLGGELAGETDKEDYEIRIWIADWLLTNKEYDLFTTNCQKFAWELIDWLTDGNFICPHGFNASNIDGGVYVENDFKTFVRAEKGNAVARLSLAGKTARLSEGIVNIGVSLPEVKVQGVAGPGAGVWADASLIRYEASVGGVVGAHISPNLNTGAGIRNGNLDVHYLGTGFKVGADGISLDTPLGGVSACNVM